MSSEDPWGWPRLRKVEGWCMARCRGQTCANFSTLTKKLASLRGGCCGVDRVVWGCADFLIIHQTTTYCGETFHDPAACNTLQSLLSEFTSQLFEHFELVAYISDYRFSTLVYMTYIKANRIVGWIQFLYIESLSPPS